MLDARMLDEIEKVTYVVELTPAGRGAVAVVLVVGPAAMTAVTERFAPVSGRSLEDLPSGRIALGRWGGENGEELVVCRLSQHEFEVHCHGGTAAVGEVIRSLVEGGCQRLSWQEWVRGSAEQAVDAIQHEARIALASAPTARTATILLDQVEGALSRAIRSVIDGERTTLQAGELLDGLLQFSELGLHLTNPWRVVLMGAPNVGKSSLINALVGYGRAIVSPVPGTTRDVVTARTAFDGWPVELSDTAGLRESADELESAGIALAARAIKTADLAIVVSEATDKRVNLTTIAPGLPPRMRTLYVKNKIDLVASKQRLNLVDKTEIVTSALTGEGVAELAAAIAESLVTTVPPAGAAVPFLADQLHAISEARTAIAQHDRARAMQSLQALLNN